MIRQQRAALNRGVTDHEYAHAAEGGWWRTPPAIKGEHEPQHGRPLSGSGGNPVMGARVGGVVL